MKYMASHQAHGEEHDGEQASLRLGLTGHTGDGLATGQAVTDGGANSAASQGQAAADHGAGQSSRPPPLWCLPLLLLLLCRFV